LWIEKLSWDEVLPFSILAKWTKFTNELSKLNELSVNRQVVCEGATKIELHGFADSSERAYGACLYIRSIDDKGNVHVNLLCAKSKVAPVKTLSIPRLELCAALLLARLTDKIINSMTITFERCVFWLDSAIALAWIQTSPNILKTFIANRVTEIQTLTKTYEWRYTPSHDNPADYLSRGLYPRMLVLIKNDQSLPTNWQLGRIVELHSGPDGIARVASIRTQSGVIRRSFQMICPLPLDD
ncbi:hypothetical protein NQ318_001649, partial [Aromia moschata]